MIALREYEWQPIETAPRDGEYFFVKTGGMNVALADGTPAYEAYFEDGEIMVFDRGSVEFPDDGRRSIRPTHWAR